MTEIGTSDIVPVNCVFCGEPGEVFSGSLANDEEYVCDLCYEAYLEPKEGGTFDRKTDQKDAAAKLGREASQGI